LSLINTNGDTDDCELPIFLCNDEWNPSLFILHWIIGEQGEYEKIYIRYHHILRRRGLHCVDCCLHTIVDNG
jgi:hypothetical protein